MLFPRAANDDGDGLDFVFYYYHPSMAAAVIFIILFGATTATHFWQLLRSRTWFMIPFLIGGIFETVGYVGRALSAGENPGPYTKIPYIIQSVLLLLAPALFAASVYMHLGRVVMMSEGDHALFIRRTWMTKIFVGGDVLSFLMQCSGAGFLVSDDSDQISMGKNLVLGGLGLQLLFFGFFVVTAAIFQARLARAPNTASKNVPWRKHLMSLYAVSILILIRSIVRIVEYQQGYDGYTMTHEVFIYLFDALLMFAAMAIMNWIHPSEVKKIIRGSRRGVTGTEAGESVGMDARAGMWK
ncbi:uncharacterized protein LTR77_006667 [Saxophila tyrrhenica]|uniref:RTA1-like protein n=1 Tax=Saxophila tyrrhenica TaxID=1690608 RepID=A0AAV9P671_9PEZI|nr:hypothetical protein LTR77_006667 [Saxophila tyrrhenica]